MPHISEIAKKADVNVLTVCMENKVAVDGFYSQYKCDYNMAIDNGAISKLMSKCFAMGVPHSFLFVNGMLKWHGHPSGFEAGYAKIMQNDKKTEWLVFKTITQHHNNSP